MIYTKLYTKLQTDPKLMYVNQLTYKENHFHKFNQIFARFQPFSQRMVSSHGHTFTQHIISLMLEQCYVI